MTIGTQSGEFYTYLWLREDGTPYYVGKGKGYRAFRTGCPPRERIIVQKWASEAEAFEAEEFLIAFYGRKDIGTGILRNFTDGGDGESGRVIGKEQREHLRSVMRGNKKCGRLGKKLSAEHRKNLSLAATRLYQTPAARLVQSAAQKKRTLSAETWACIRAASRRPKSAQARTRMSTAAKERVKFSRRGENGAFIGA